MNNNFKQGFKKFAVVSASALFALSLGGGAVNAMHTNVHAETADQMLNNDDTFKTPQATIQREHKIVNNCVNEAKSYPAGAITDLYTIHDQQDINTSAASKLVGNIVNKYDATHTDVANPSDNNNPTSWYGKPSSHKGNINTNTNRRNNVKKSSNHRPAKKAPARKNHAKRASNNSGLKITKVSHHRHSQKKHRQGKDKQIKSLKRTMRRLTRRISKIMKRKHISYTAKKRLNKLDNAYLDDNNRLERITHKSLHKFSKKQTVKHLNYHHSKKSVSYSSKR